MEEFIPFLRLDALALACLVGKGLSDKEIAPLLGKSEAHIGHMVSDLLREGNMRSRSQLANAYPRFLASIGIDVRANNTNVCLLQHVCVIHTHCQGTFRQG